MTLAETLTLEELGGDEWRAWTPPGSVRPDIFGGQVAGQALLAGSRTVDPAFLASSVHCSFLRRGQPALPLDIRVERTRAGRTYANRRIEVVQDGKLIFTMLATFHVDEPSTEYVHPMPAGVPDPDALDAAEGEMAWDPGFEVRTVDIPEPDVRFWCRATGTFPNDPVMQRSGLLYASDMRSGGPAMIAVGFAPFGLPAPGSTARAAIGNFGSLDHALWFHRSPRIDEWFLSDIQAIAVRDSRGLVLGRIFDRAGLHVATFTQEMFLKAATEPTA